MREIKRVIQRFSEKSCRLIFLQSSVYYYCPHRRDETRFRMRFIELSNIHVRCGIDRLYFLLKLEGWKDSSKMAYRIYCNEGLNLRRKRNKRIKSSQSRVPTNGITSTLHECWSMDFKSDVF